MARIGTLLDRNNAADANSLSPVDVSLPRIWTLGLKDAFEALSKYRVRLSQFELMYYKLPSNSIRYR